MARWSSAISSGSGSWPGVSVSWPTRRRIELDSENEAGGEDLLPDCLPRVADYLDELARARRVQDLTTAAVLPDPRAQRRRRLAEPDLEFRAFCARRGLPASSTLQLERAWDA